MSNIHVKGGEINYEIIKDLTVQEHIDRIKFYVDQILELEGKDIWFFKYQLVNLYKDYIFVDCDISYDDKELIDAFFLKLINYFNTILNNDSIKFHINRIKSELNMSEDIKIALTKLYKKIHINDNKKVYKSHSLIRGVFNPIQSENYINKKSCEKFFDVITTRSNPEYDIKHNITLFVSAEQLNTYILNNIKQNNDELVKTIKLSNNIYEDTSLEKSMKIKLNDKSLDKNSGIETVKHIFDNNRSGIYVSIKNNKVVMFAPFVNDEYENKWNNITFDSADGSMKTYYKSKQKLFRKEDIIDVKRWWNNGHIISNEHTDDYWSDYGFLQLRNMFDELCANKIVSDCEFIINKRDCPLNYSKSNTIPILSFYSNSDYSDINIPLAEDWELACQFVFPKGNNKFYACAKDVSDANFIKNKISWVKKKEIAIFRGAATGRGITVETNQRLNLAKTYEKSKLVDAKLTSWNMRDKVIKGSLSDDTVVISYIKYNEIKLDVGKHNFVSMMEQMKYKYIIYVDGHSASNRYSFMMKTGSVILKVDSFEKVANEMWYSTLLKPYVDHVPIKSDLSDLEDKIKWCKANDDKCKLIASNAFRLYNRVITKGSIMDYLQLVCYNISTKYKDNYLIESELDLKYSFELEYAKYKIAPFIEKTNVLNNIKLPEVPNIKIKTQETSNNNITELINKKNELDQLLVPYLTEYEKEAKKLANNIYEYIDNN